MRYLILLLFVSILTAEQPVAPLRKGDDAARVTEVLGPANGSVQTAKSGILFFDRGEVHTRHGKVSQIYLISEEELAKQEIEEHINRANRKEEGEKRLAALQEKGNYTHLSGREQVRFWDSFSKRYPEVDIQELYLKALALAQKEEEEAAEARRIARLEQRVLEAELRAAQAAERAANAQALAATAYRRPAVRVVTPYYVGTPYGWSTSRRYLKGNCGTLTRSTRTGTVRTYPKPTVTRDTSLFRINIR